MDTSPVRPLPRAVRGAPWALLAAAAVFDLSTSPDQSALPLFVLACVTCAAIASRAETVALCGTALALTAAADLLQRGAEVTAHHYVDLLNIGFAGVVSVVLQRFFWLHRGRLAAARTVADTAQWAVLPPPPGDIDGLRVAARYHTAEAEARVGGDLYAAQATPFGTRFLIGDVRGKGLGAVAAVAYLLGVFREAADTAPDLPGLAARLENALEREARRRRGEAELEGFTTALLGEISSDQRHLRLVNRGHPAAYLLLPDRPRGTTVRTLDPQDHALPLGLGSVAPSGETVQEVELPERFVLLLLTDGVTEARDTAGHFFDPAAWLRGHHDHAHDPGQLIDELSRAVHAWSGGVRDDDMAVLAIGRLP